MIEKHYKGIGELWRLSREAVRRNLGAFLFLNILSILSVAWSTGSTLRDKTNGSNWYAIFKNTLFGSNGDSLHIGGAFFTFILFVVGIALALMSVILTLRAAQKDKVELSEVWADFKENWLWLRIIGVELLVVFILLLGFIALIIPGIYLLGRVTLAPYILVDQNTKVFEAVEKSWHLTRDRMWQVYSVLLFSIVLSLPNIIPIIGPVIAFVLVLSYSVAMPLRYLDLKHHRRSPAAKS